MNGECRNCGGVRKVQFISKIGKQRCVEFSFCQLDSNKLCLDCQAWLGGV